MSRSGHRRSIVGAMACACSTLWWSGDCPAATSTPASSQEQVWTPDTCVPVSINGVRLNLAISTADPVAVYLNPDAARRAGLVARGLSRLFGVRYRIGPTLAFEGRSRRLPISVLNHAPEAAEVIWFEDNPIHPHCDGYVSIWSLAAPRISLVQPAAPAPTRDITISMTPNGQRIVNFNGAIEVGGHSYLARLDLDDPDSQVNATAAAELSDTGKLALTGEFRMHVIRFGVERPVELAHPDHWPPFGLPVSDVFVRRESLGATPPPQPSADLAHDPDEVAPVIINGRRSSDNRYAWISLGYRALARCRSLTFDRTTHTVTLACAD